MLKRPILGDLEQAVLDYLWEHQQGDAKSVHAVIGKQRNISLNTIQSTLERLHKKQLLKRSKIVRAYSYEPAIERNDLVKLWINDVVGILKADKNDIIVSAFMDLTGEVDTQQLLELEKIIAQKKAQLEE